MNWLWLLQNSLIHITQNHLFLISFLKSSRMSSPQIFVILPKTVCQKTACIIISLCSLNASEETSSMQRLCRRWDESRHSRLNKLSDQMYSCVYMPCIPAEKYGRWPMMLVIYCRIVLFLCLNIYLTTGFSLLTLRTDRQSKKSRQLGDHACHKITRWEGDVKGGHRAHWSKSDWWSKDGW